MHRKATKQKEYMITDQLHINCANTEIVLPANDCMCKLATFDGNHDKDDDDYKVLLYIHRKLVKYTQHYTCLTHSTDF